VCIIVDVHLPQGSDGVRPQLLYYVLGVGRFAEKVRVRRRCSAPSGLGGNGKRTGTSSKSELFAFHPYLCGVSE